MGRHYIAIFPARQEENVFMMVSGKKETFLYISCHVNILSIPKTNKIQIENQLKVKKK